MNEIEPLQPFLVSKVWGGERLLNWKGLSKDEVYPLGETWEISRHDSGPSTTLGGQKLNDLLTEKELPYLVKLIDTTDHLSIQVHPGDEYARQHENSLGKTECWLILEADSEAGIYLGLKEGVTKERLKEAIETREDVSQLLTFYPVKAGDFFYVPAGSIHAIGKNVTLAEIQQSSGVTYRVWDWNRVGLDGKPRELHVDKALDVINFDKQHNNAETFRVKKDCLSHKEIELIDHDSFKVQLLRLNSGEEREWTLSSKNREVSLMVLKGPMMVNGTELPPYSSARVLSDNGVTLHLTGSDSQKGSECLIIS